MGLQLNVYISYLRCKGNNVLEDRWECCFGFFQHPLDYIVSDWIKSGLILFFDIQSAVLARFEIACELKGMKVLVSFAIVMYAL